MRGLAAFIMRGRFQAALIALVGNLVPMISPATVGLVSLRRGVVDGAMILAWAALPMFVVTYAGGVNVLIVAASVTGLVSVAVSAEVLKRSVSWQWALLSVLLTSALGICLVAAMATLQTQSLVAELQVTMGALQDEASQQVASVFHLFMAATALGLGVQKSNVVFVIGVLSWLAVVHAVGSLLLARWWQALLYNPGGFQREFHALRLEKVIAGALLAGILACNLAGPAYMTWGSLLGIPLLLGGLGLVHHAVQFLQLGTYWLVFLYIGLVLVGPLSVVLIGVGFLDSFFDFRSRLAARRQR